MANNVWNGSSVAHRPPPSTWLRALGNHLCLHHSLFWYWERTWRWSSRAAAGWSTSFQQTFHIIQLCPWQEKQVSRLTQKPLFHWSVILPWLNHLPVSGYEVVLSGGATYLITKLQGLISGTKYNYILQDHHLTHSMLPCSERGGKWTFLTRKKEWHAAICHHEDWVPETLQTYPEQQHPLSYTWSPWNKSHGTYICQREMRSAVGLLFHSLGREEADHEYGVRCICALGWEWIFRLKWIPSFLLSMFHLAVLLLDLSSTRGPCELVVNWFGWLFVLGWRLATFNSRMLYFTHWGPLLKSIALLLPDIQKA